MQWVEYADHWRSFNTEKYDDCSEALTVDMGKDFLEAFPVETYYQCARIIESNGISKFIRDEAVAAEMVHTEREVLNANCWGVKNQGMLRKGRTRLFAEYKTTSDKMWLNISNESDHFRKGSIVLIQSSGTEDRFQGFRDRLQAKYAWLYGYLCSTQATLWAKLEDMEHNDPIGKVLHRVRPSEREKVEVHAPRTP